MAEASSFFQFNPPFIDLLQGHNSAVLRKLQGSPELKVMSLGLVRRRLPAIAHPDVGNAAGRGKLRDMRLLGVDHRHALGVAVDVQRFLGVVRSQRFRGSIDADATTAGTETTAGVEKGVIRALPLEEDRGFAARAKDAAILAAWKPSSRR